MSCFVALFIKPSSFLLEQRNMHYYLVQQLGLKELNLKYFLGFFLTRSLVPLNQISCKVLIALLRFLNLK